MYRLIPPASNNFATTEFGNKAEGFDHPTQLPRDDVERHQWQAANKAWWESTPMRYDWRDAIPAAPGTRDYYKEIDRRFLDSVRKYMPWSEAPFDALIPFSSLGNQDVLEIGVGQGTHAQIIAPRCKSFTGIDLTEYASSMTASRFTLFDIPGRIVQMDAESMMFPDNSFDFIWSWGVIHHSANTHKILEEMHRVLRPDGRATVMVYHRSWWHFYFGGLVRGIFRGQFRGKRGLHQVAQCATDGAIARFYTSTEWQQTTRDLFEIDAVKIYGLKVELLPLPAGRFKGVVERLIPNGVGRLLTNHMRLGSFLVAEMHKVE
jgi:ubiquinone/menaquinone biosynthesis C-methylase UbiE